MIEKGKEMITIFGNSLLKSNQLLVLRLQRFGQQIIQHFTQIGAILIWIIIIGRSKLFFKFMCFLEHRPESDRPGHFVTLRQVFGFTFQVRRTHLMFLHRGLKVCFPTIMNKYSLSIYSTHVFINSSCSPVGRSRNISSMFVLPCPEPMLFPIYFHTRFICTNNPAMQYSLPDHFISIDPFRCQPVQQKMQATFTYLNRKDVIQHFLKSFERKVLSDTKITDESFNIIPISDRTINTNRKITFYHLTANTLASINPVFGDYLFDCGYINNLSFPKKLERLITHIFSAFRTKTRTMLNNFIGCTCHLQCFPFMSRLSACFTITFLPKTAGAWWPVLIFRRWQRAIVTVFFCCVSFQFPFKNFNSCNQQRNFSKFLCLHQNDALQFLDDYLIRCFHNLCYKTNPEIQYIKERNRLVINSKKHIC